MNSKKGGLIAEAAVVFPVVLISVLAVVHILIAMYMETSYSARDHMALRHESGVSTQTVERTNEYRQLIPQDKFGRAPFKENAEITGEFRLPDHLLLAERGRVYVIDEAGYIRKIDLLNKLGEGL